jgi:PhnB protein
MALQISSRVQPYLSFEGRCEEALEFYRRALGAELTTLIRYRDSSDPRLTANTDDKVLHASFRIGQTTLLAFDGRCGGEPVFRGISLNLTADEAEASHFFSALTDGGQVQTPLSRTLFSPCHGVVTDRFGVSWVIEATRLEAHPES